MQSDKQAATRVNGRVALIQLARQLSERCRNADTLPRLSEIHALNTRLCDAIKAAQATPCPPAMSDRGQQLIDALAAAIRPLAGWEVNWLSTEEGQRWLSSRTITFADDDEPTSKEDLQRRVEAAKQKRWAAAAIAFVVPLLRPAEDAAEQLEGFDVRVKAAADLQLTATPDDGEYITATEARTITAWSLSRLSKLCKDGGPVKFKRPSRRLLLIHAADLARHVAAVDAAND